MRVSKTTEKKDACPRCNTEGFVQVGAVHAYPHDTVRWASCALCGADLDPDTLADLGTTDGD